MWGGNNKGQLGDGTNEDKNTPVKIMENVKNVNLGVLCSGAITEDGNLWMWGCLLYTSDAADDIVVV